MLWFGLTPRTALAERSQLHAELQTRALPTRRGALAALGAPAALNGLRSAGPPLHRGLMGSMLSRWGARK